MALNPTVVIVGNSVRVNLAVADAADTATDPTSIEARLLAPDGTETEPSVTDQAGTGNYRVEVTLDAPGTWYLRVKSTTPTAVVEIPLVAGASQFASPW